MVVQLAMLHGIVSNGAVIQRSSRRSPTSAAMTGSNEMRRCFLVCALALLVITTGTARAIADQTTFVVTSSNGVNNELLVFDALGTLIQAVPTQGAGGISGNAGGVAALN